MLKLNEINILIHIKLFFLNLLKTNKKEKKEFFISSFSMVFTIISLIFVNWMIYSFYPDNTESLRALAEKIIIEYHHGFIEGMGGNIWPEPIEQLQIITTFFLIPILIFIYTKVFYKYFNQIFITNNMYFLNLLLCSSILGILFYCAFIINISSLFQLDTYPFHQGIRNFYQLMISEFRFLITLIFFPVIAYYIFNGIPKKQEKWINWILYLFIVILLLSVFFLSLSNRDNYLGHPLHLSTILYPISQVQQGKSLLVDFYSSQYGLYSHFLYPFFKLINVNVITFSLTMSALTTISYSLIFFGLRKIISNNLIVFLSFVAIIYISFFHGFLTDNFDIYYQYRPLRILFPALILFSVFTYIINPSKFKYLLIIFISSLAMLWNFDSGVICFLSFYIYILYERLMSNNLRIYALEFFKHTLTSVSILILTFFLYSMIIYFQSNNFPDWNSYLINPKLFGITGFFSLPMPIFNAWNFIFLVYLYGIYIGINSILFNKIDPLDKVAFFVSIFGFGISGYYLNRSADSNLLHVLYPTFILLAIFLSKVLDKNAKESLFQIKNFITTSIISFILVVILFQILQPIKVINTITNRIPDIANDRLTSKKLSDGHTLFNLNSNINDQVVILSEFDGLMYLETKTSSPFSSPGYMELILKSDWDKLQNNLIDNKSYKVYVSGDYLKTDFGPKTRYSAIKKIFADHYYLDDWFGRWRMFVPKKAPISQPGIKATASYSLFCQNNAKNCNSTVKNFLPVENLPKNNKYIKVDFNLSEPITLQSILLNIIIDSHYAGTVTTLPVEGIWNIGILDHNNKQFVNTDARLEHLDYEVKESFSVLISDYSNYIKTCEPFNIELIYNDNQKLKVRASCK